jgi:hypothetical protein
MLGLVIATIVIAFMNRPQAKPKSKGALAAVSEGSDPLGDMGTPSLDFGDELAQMDGGNKS